jgi:hypothetical protein
MPRSRTVLAAGEGKKPTTVVINKKYIDAILITQLSHEDATIMEARVGSVTFVIASMYFDITRPIEEDLKKNASSTDTRKRTGTIFTIDSNARSTTWHDVLTNKRGKKLEEFLIGNHLYIANEESCNTTFQTPHGASNIDLTIFNNTAIKYLLDWTIYDRESCSDHIIQYTLGDEAFQAAESNNSGKRYTVTQENMGKFQAKVIQTLEQIAKETGTENNGVDKLEKNLVPKSDKSAKHRDSSG